MQKIEFQNRIVRVGKTSQILTFERDAIRTLSRPTAKQSNQISEVKMPLIQKAIKFVAKHSRSAIRFVAKHLRSV